MVGGLFAFMMLGGRVAQPLVGLARLVEDYEEVRAAVGEAGYVLNRPLEVDAPSGGLRPQFAGAIEFHDVTFTYPGIEGSGARPDQLQRPGGHDARASSGAADPASRRSRACCRGSIANIAAS